MVEQTNKGDRGVAGPIHGAGIGLRTPHYAYIEQEQPSIPWFEVLVDNYLGKGGLPLRHLELVRRDYPITFHGVGMSLGSTDPLNRDYLERLKDLVERFQPAYVSDHLCWVSAEGRYGHELFPLPYVESVVNHVVERVQCVQEFLGRSILIENVSSYLTYKISDMEEWDFLSLIAERAGCEILLDINNVYVSACNHGFDPEDYILKVPVDRVRQFHLAGHEDQGTHLLDSHSNSVHDSVWELYKKTLLHLGPLPTLIEWDNNIPEFPVLYAEAAKAQGLMRTVCVDVA